MKLKKIDLLSSISLIEQLYKGLIKEFLTQAEFLHFTSIIVKTCNSLRAYYQDEPSFQELLDYTSHLLRDQKDVHLIRHKRNKVLSLLKNFSLSMMNTIDVNLYLCDCSINDIPLDISRMNSVKKISRNAPNYIAADPEISVLVYDDRKKGSIDIKADITFSLTSLLQTQEHFTKTLFDIEYFTYTRLFLESKLNSLKERQDIELLLVGSSYTMYGLFENQMPIAARNVAVDAQDIYYSVQTVRKALAYNPNIKHIVFSFAYYLWGTDISLSNSDEHQPRIREINYPIFKDKHHFKGEIDEITNVFLTRVTPFQEFLLPFNEWSEQKSAFVSNSLKDANYALLPRNTSKAAERDEQTNLQEAKQTVIKHEKTIEYETTIQENLQIFSDFLQEMNEKNINVLVFVPPMSNHYQQCFNPDLITSYYKLMDPLKVKYDFKLLDLYDDETFKDGDFFDYDHLNDQGAEKLSTIISNELDL